MQCFHRFLDGGRGRAQAAMGVAVDDKLVHVIHAQALQAGVNPLHNVLAGKAALVRVPAHGRGHFGRDHIVFTLAQLTQQRPHHLLARAQAIGVGAVEIIDPQIQRLLEDRPRLVDIQRPVALVTHPRLTKIHRPQAKTRDLQAALAQLCVFQHGGCPGGGIGK